MSRGFHRRCAIKLSPMLVGSAPKLNQSKWYLIGRQCSSPCTSGSAKPSAQRSAQRRPTHRGAQRSARPAGNAQAARAQEAAPSARPAGSAQRRTGQATPRQRVRPTISARAQEAAHAQQEGFDLHAKMQGRKACNLSPTRVGKSQVEVNGAFCPSNGMSVPK